MGKIRHWLKTLLRTMPDPLGYAMRREAIEYRRGLNAERTKEDWECYFWGVNKKEMKRIRERIEQRKKAEGRG